MIAVQAVDGKFYVNPWFEGPKWALSANQDIELSYKSPRGKMVSWATARKVLRPAGIRATWATLAYLGNQVIDGKLACVTVFPLRLTGPIPVPKTFEQVLDSEPAPGDFEIISWRKK